LIAKEQAEQEKAKMIVDRDLHNQELQDIQDKKNVYKQTLLYQQAMREKGLHNYGKMTK